jgi:hypothetical protein
MISFDIRTPGMKTIQRKLEEIERLANGRQPFRGVQMLALERQDDEANNAEVLENLDRLGYHFALLSEAEQGEVAEAFEQEVERRMAGPNPNAANVAAGALREAMDALSRIVAEHIERGEGVTKDLSEGYKELKLREHGFVYPIGKATGQLLRNLSSGKVKLTT